MKKLLIYFRDSPETPSYLIRSVRVTADFVGIGNKGQINEGEFNKLAADLAPGYYKIQIVNL